MATDSNCTTIKASYKEMLRIIVTTKTCGLKLLCLMFNNSHDVMMFPTFFAHILEICYLNFERFIKNALNRSIFELEKCSFF